MMSGRETPADDRPGTASPSDERGEMGADDGTSTADDKASATSDDPNADANEPSAKDAAAASNKVRGANDHDDTDHDSERVPARTQSAEGQGPNTKHSGSTDSSSTDLANGDPDDSSAASHDVAAATDTSAGENTDAPNKTDDKKHPWSPLRVVAALVVFALVAQFVLVPLFSDFSSTWSKIKTIDPWTMLVAAVVEIVVWGMYGDTFRILLPRRDRASVWVFVGTSIAAKGISHVVPAGAATTAAVDYKLLHQAGVPDDELVFAFTAAGAMTTVTLNVLLAISLMFSLPESGATNSYTTPLVFGVLLVVGLSLLVVALVRNPTGVGHVAASLIGWIPGVKRESVVAAVVRVGQQLQTLIADPRRLLWLIMNSIVKWLLGALAFWIVLESVGKPPGLFEVFVAFALANVSAAIPLTPGGIGVFEAVMISTLVAYGTPHAEAAAGVLAFRLLNFWMPIPLGALTYVWVDQATKRGIGVSPARREELAAQPAG